MSERDRGSDDGRAVDRCWTVLFSPPLIDISHSGKHARQKVEEIEAGSVRRVLVADDVMVCPWDVGIGDTIRTMMRPSLSLVVVLVRKFLGKIPLPLVMMFRVRFRVNRFYEVIHGHGPLNCDR